MFSLRKEQVFQTHYEYSIDHESVVIKASLYCCEELLCCLKGVSSYGRDVITRVMQWRIVSTLRHAV
ncbi:hypothetical protein [Aliivibrio sp. 1S128]|uniref:hypothetical protein n=1 Tax=Aliivibrio sp. 1S128 TaxID=1840085 RepID=UPI001147832B|nr:hypothetical protein [Aliivibrio sp. 1S128]